MKWAVDLFWGAFYRPFTGVFKGAEKRADLIWGIVQGIYVFNLYLAFIVFQRVSSGFAQPPFDPLWPVFFIRFFDFEWVKLAVAGGYLLASIAAVCVPKRRWVRVAVCITLVMASGLMESYGKINHGNHHLILTLFGFVFLNSRDSFKTVVLFFSTQAIILMTYSLSGFWKLLAAVYQLFFDSVSAFNVNAMAEHSAFHILSSGNAALLSDVIFQVPWLFWIMLWGGIYIEFYSIAVLFRTSLHRAWGVFLILLHIGTYMLLDVGFVQPILILGMLLALSPFYRPAGWVQSVAQLPWLGSLFMVGRGWFEKEKRPEIKVFYDSRSAFGLQLAGLFMQSRFEVSAIPLEASGDGEWVADIEMKNFARGSFFVCWPQADDLIVLKNIEAIWYLLSLSPKWKWVACMAVVPTFITEPLFFCYRVGIDILHVRKEAGRV